MTRLKNIMVLLLAAALVAAGAVLPSAVSHFRDRNGAGKVEYADMPSLQLSLTHESGLDLYEKLFLLSGDLDTLEISTQETKMTAQEVEAAAFAGVQAYLDLGFLGRIPEDYHFSSYPLLVYTVDNPEQYIIVWTVEMALDAGSENWGIVLDDETGKILIIEFNSSYLQWQKEEMYSWLEVITAVYIKSLELTDDDAAYTWDETYNDGYYASKILCIQREGDLPVFLMIEVYGVGFSVYVMPYGDVEPTQDGETMP